MTRPEHIRESDIPELRAVTETGHVQLHVTAGHLADWKHDVLLLRTTAHGANVYKQTYLNVNGAALARGVQRSVLQAVVMGTQ